MKIYISEKDVIFGNSNQLHLKIIEDRPLMFMPTEKELTKKPSIYTLPIHSLEQHEAEIRKPLEDEIKRLNNVVNNKAQLRCTKCGQVYYGDYDPLTFVCKCELLKQAKQEWNNELLEWVESNKVITHTSNGKNYGYMNLELLRNKLNEMKEVE